MGHERVDLRLHYADWAATARRWVSSPLRNANSAYTPARPHRPVAGSVARPHTVARLHTPAPNVRALLVRCEWGLSA